MKYFIWLYLVISLLALIHSALCWNNRLLILKSYQNEPMILQTANIEELLKESKKMEMQTYKYWGIYAFSGVCISLTLLYINRKENKK